MNVVGFKPNLIPNNPKDGSFTKEERNKVIGKNGGISEYFSTLKKDGCRLQLGLTNHILSRSLKAPKSVLVNERFQKLNDLCIELKIAIDGEFYMHGLKFNEIFRFFSNTDVTSDKYRIKLEKEFKKDPNKFVKDYNNKSIKWLTTFHEGLKFWSFDGIILDRPDLTGFAERIREITNRLKPHVFDFPELVLPELMHMFRIESLDEIYRHALDNGFEGLVLTHKDHEYKYGRNSIKQGTILKLKDDSIEYDGVVIDVVEGTVSKEGTETTKNELGRSVRSQKKEDRRPSGKAKGFLIEFEGLGTFTVGLRSFDDQAKVDLLKYKEHFIGRHFKYTAMTPVKDFPRHAYFDCWRDEK